MTSCSRCGSAAINHHAHGRDGSDGDLCDVCYWRKRAEGLLAAQESILWQAQGNGFIGDSPDEAMAWAVRQMGEACRLRKAIDDFADNVKHLSSREINRKGPTDA